MFTFSERTRPDGPVGMSLFRLRGKLPFNPADGTPLEDLSKHFFEKGLYQLSGIVSYDARFVRSDAKLQKAFDHAVLVTPILQTRVEGDKEPVFRMIQDRQAWPKLEILPNPVGTDESAEALIREFKAKTQGKFFSDRDYQRTSIRISSCRGKTVLYVCLMVPHQFFDGNSIGTFLIRFTAYARLPRACWFMFDPFFRDRHFPTYMEMALKSDMDKLHDTDGSLVAHLKDPSRFQFNDYDHEQPGAIECMRGLPLEKVGSHHSQHVMKKVRQGLREQGVTVSSAFTGLAVKVMATLLKHKTGEKPGPLVVSVASDLRPLGKWGDRRDRTFLPVVGNYPYSHVVRVEFDDAANKSVEELGIIVKQDLKRVHTDVDYRLSLLQHSDLNPGYYCGVSSLLIPKQATRLGFPTIVDSFIAFGPVPHVWFYVITTGDKTQVHADIQMPIDTLEADEIRHLARETIQGTVLAPVFNELKTAETYPEHAQGAKGSGTA